MSLKETKSKIFNLETKERSEYKSVQNQNPHEKVANTYTEDQKRSLQQWWLPDNKWRLVLTWDLKKKIGTRKSPRSQKLKVTPALNGAYGSTMGSGCVR